MLVMLCVPALACRREVSGRTSTFLPASDSSLVAQCIRRACPEQFPCPLSLIIVLVHKQECMGPRPPGRDIMPELYVAPMHVRPDLV